MFNTDKPIKSEKEDLLGRSQFSKYFGEAISIPNQDSLVIGLFGEWGSGKTSILNLSIEFIENKFVDEEIKPIIIRFNPWNFSDQNQLIAQFFKQLSSSLNRKDYGKEAKKIGEKLEAYSKFFEPLKFIPFIDQYVDIAKEGMEKSGAAIKKWGQIKEDDLETTKKEINEMLTKKAIKIIIIIDDIDRLNNDEIKQIFQLVKSLADFPYTTYILAFDKSIVLNALQEVQKGDGNEYLEKVIQVPFEIPKVREENIQKLLFDEIDQIIFEIPENKWDKDYWSKIYTNGFRDFFKNIRDVKRYINCLKFNFEIIKNEVNPIDFLAITTFQVFIPEVYNLVRENKDVFSGVFEESTFLVKTGYSSGNNEKVENIFNEMVDKAPGKLKNSADRLLKQLFPKFVGNYGNAWLSEWRQKCRVCSPDHFDTYFRLALSQGELSQIEIDRIISISNDSDKFKNALLELNKEGKIVRFLERFEDYTTNIVPLESIPNIIRVLMDIGDLFPEGESNFFVSFDTPMRILRIFHQLSFRFDDPQKRFEIFKEAIENCENSLYTVVHEVGVQNQQHAKYGLAENKYPDNELTVLSHNLIELEKLAVNKIKSSIINGSFATHPKFYLILYYWKLWTNKETVENYIKELVKDDSGFVNFIVGFFSYSTIFDENGTRKIPQMNYPAMKEYTDIRDFKKRIDKISKSDLYTQLIDNQKLALNTFIRNIENSGSRRQVDH